MSEGLTSRNGIKAGDKVIWIRPSKAYPRQNSLAKQLLAKSTPYTVEFVFPGDEFEQIELKEIPDTAFIHDMFAKLPGK